MQMLVRPAIDAVRDYETYVSKNFISISNSYKLVNEVFENRCAPFQKMGHSRKADLFGWFRKFWALLFLRSRFGASELCESFAALAVRMNDASCVGGVLSEEDGEAAA